MRRIVTTGPQPVDMLDLVGPLEVFKFAPEYEVAVASPEGTTELQLNHGFKISDAVPFTKLAAQIDTLVVAGGPGANDELYDDHYLKRITELAARSRRVAAICTGTFVLAAAGLLDGKRAVTHWAYCDKLSRQYPSVVVEPDRIYLRDGSIYTSAGITAGMDLALALVEEDHGHQVALEIARILVMFLVRPGGQSQYSHMLSRQAATSQPLRELQVWMIENLRENLSVERLAKRMGMSSRNFPRVCLRETRMNPGQFVDRMRVEAAQQMIDSSAMGLKEIADACGFQTPLAMRRTFLRVLGITAGEYASRFKRSQRPPETKQASLCICIGASRISKRRRNLFAELSRGPEAISCEALGGSEVAHFDETCAFVQVNHLASRVAQVPPGCRPLGSYRLTTGLSPGESPYRKLENPLVP